MISVQVRYAFDVMGLAPEQVADVFMVLSGVLHLGNVTYVSAAGAQIAEKSGTALFLSLSLSFHLHIFPSSTHAMVGCAKCRILSVLLAELPWLDEQ